MRLTPTKWLNNWCTNGYQRVDLVEVKGELARRGDILDVYPLTTDAPIRIEFFGDEIDAIRLFDPASQRSVTDGIDDEPETITLCPVREIILSPKTLDLWKTRAGNTDSQQRIA